MRKFDVFIAALLSNYAVCSSFFFFLPPNVSILSKPVCKAGLSTLEAESAKATLSPTESFLLLMLHGSHMTNFAFTLLNI